MANLFISYDITNDRLRTKTAKILERHGCKRVQKSVFYAARFEAAEVRKLRAELSRLVGPHLEEQDSILCIPVTQNYLDDLVWQGDRTFFERLFPEILVKMM
jgi:CRISPR-associated protein Cas2